MASPRDDEAPEAAYAAAWAETRTRSIEQGLSWSGNEENHLFVNLGNLQFADVSALSGCDSPGDGRSIALLDWDDDGRMDLLLRNRTAPRLQLFRNDYPAGAGFLTIELEGNGTSTNRDGIGARVVVEAGGLTLVRTLRAGEGFLAQSSKRLHFGLGPERLVRRLTVRWTDGTIDTFAELEGNARYRIVQGAAEPIPVAPRRAVELAEVGELPTPSPETKGWRVVLERELPMDAVPIPGLGSKTTATRTIADLSGAPVLLSMWHLACAPCLSQLNQMRVRRAEVDASGLQLITINVDQPEELDRAREWLSWYDLDGTEADYRDRGLASALAAVHDEVLGATGGPIAPTSFLLDSAGSLCVVYLGPVNIDRLVEDVAELASLDARPVLDRLAHGIRLARSPRDIEGLARRLDAARLPELAAHYRRLTADASETAGAAGSIPSR